MRRREFIAGLGGAATWPLVAQAQQPERIRRIGVLMPSSEKDTEGTKRLVALRESLQKLGWVEGRNIQIDYRWAPQGDQLQTAAKELVALAPELILVQSDPATAALLRETRTISIVFVTVGDPIGGGRLAMQRDSLISSPRLVASGLSF
jgi:putative ABC transport system substrate-binding protein